MQNANCAAKYVYDNLTQSTTGFTFCISAGTGSASYNPVSKSINFTTDYAASRVDILEHEMFHAFQDVYYPNGTSKYGKDAITGIPSPGFSNIELEQAVFNDIVHNGTTAFDKGTAQQKIDYQRWLSGVTSDFKKYPKLTAGTTAYTNFITEYNKYLSLFSKNPANPLSGPTISLNPNALINLFNQTKCN